MSHIAGIGSDKLGAGRSTRRALLLVVVLIVAVAATGCLAKSGSYAPIDWAAEMHYSQSYRVQEPPRLTSPLGAVPFKFASDTRELTREPFIGPGEYSALTNPVTRTAATSAAGAELFRVNCSMCHGNEGLGDGRVSAFLLAYGSAPAANLTGAGTVSRTDGEIFELIVQGGATSTLLGMPAFKNLLSPSDRWLLVDYIRELQGN
jgi:mono/diheme cytochrome c family protein